jgi:hypothetical protein
MRRDSEGAKKPLDLPLDLVHLVGECGVLGSQRVEERLGALEMEHQFTGRHIEFGLVRASATPDGDREYKDELRINAESLLPMAGHLSEGGCRMPDESRTTIRPVSSLHGRAREYRMALSAMST